MSAVLGHALQGAEPIRRLVLPVLAVANNYLFNDNPDNSSSRLLIADASSLIFRGGIGGCSIGDSSNGNAYRRKIWSQYKMQRRECPDIIRWQLRNTHKVSEDIGFYYASLDSYEGDDIINTVVRTALDQNFESVHVIGDDKDLFSLCFDPRVTIYRHSGSLSPKIINIQNPNREPIPVADCKVLPCQIPDYLALMGDSVDNIPGCPQIGRMRAKWLLDHYGSIDECSIDSIFANLDHIAKTKKSVSRHLRENQDLIRKFKRLTTLQNVSHRMDIKMQEMECNVDRFDIEQLEIKLKDFYRMNHAEISGINSY